MSKRQKLLSFAVFLVIFSLIFGSSVFAETATTTVNNLQSLIQQLQEQIKTLQTKIEALRQAQTEVKGAGQEVTETLKLIRQLSQGMTGDDVKALQAALTADPNIYPEGLITGYYGSLTVQAVKRFQKKWGLEQVGWIGPKTLKKINQILEENPLSTEDSDEGSRPCAIVPPGHLIAPGWLKKQDGVKPIVPQCQILPSGIAKKLLPQPPATSTPPAIDTTPPTISSVSASNIASTTANIIWTTNESAASKTYYSTTTPLDLDIAFSVSDAALVTSHSLSLTGLAASTTYYFAVESKDATGNTATSTEQSFETLAE